VPVWKHMCILSESAYTWHCFHMKVTRKQ
jgi:hypothetical protein